MQLLRIFTSPICERDFSIHEFYSKTIFMKRHRFCAIATLLLLQLSISLCRAHSYLVEPQWTTGESEFRKAYITAEGELIDTYMLMEGDTVNAFSVGTASDYDLDISLELYNYSQKPYADYPLYYRDGKGRVRKSKKRPKCPVYGWVWGMSDMQHYNAVWMRSTESEADLYDDTYVCYNTMYCVVTVNGTDTTYHKEWSLCPYDTRNISATGNHFWLQSRNNTVWIGGGLGVDVPWVIIHNVTYFGNLTGLYLGAAASAGVKNAFITVREKPMPERTKWRRENLTEYFASENKHPIEGFWRAVGSVTKDEQIKVGGDYEVAIVQNGQQYDIIYLSGAKIYPGKWQTGMVKGILKANSLGIYDLLWYDAEGREVGKSFATHENNALTLVFANDKANMLFSRETNYARPKPEFQYYTGSGFALTPSGYVATNYHVIRDAKDIRVYGTEGKFTQPMQATVVAQDTVNDLAILKIENEEFNGFGELPYGFSTRIPTKGETLFYLGYPRPGLFNEEVKTSTGQVTAQNGFIASTYMVSIDIDHGSSGSPVFDMDGMLAGVMVSILTQTPITANFAIKTPYLYRLLETIEPDAHKIQKESKIRKLSHPEMISAIAPYVLRVDCVK